MTSLGGACLPQGQPGHRRGDCLRIDLRTKVPRRRQEDAQPAPASTSSTSGELLTTSSLGRGCDADPARPRLCRPCFGLSWWADRVPVAIRPAGSSDRQPACRRSDGLNRVRHDDGWCQLCFSTLSTILLIALVRGILLGIALAVLLPEVRRGLGGTRHIRDGIAFMGRSARSFVATTGGRDRRWLVGHLDHPFTDWKAIPKQARKQAVPTERRSNSSRLRYFIIPPREFSSSSVGGPFRVRDKVVRHSTRREGVNSLMGEIDHLLVVGPSPGRCADACRVLQGLVIDEPEIHEDE
jgi:hypothetical protein